MCAYNEDDVNDDAWYYEVNEWIISEGINPDDLDDMEREYLESDYKQHLSNQREDHSFYQYSFTM